MTTIAIVGGGIAGLALAGSLDPHRFSVTLHEQRADLAVLGSVGTSLAMWANGRAALDALGILDAVRATSPLLDALPIRDGAGRLFATPRAPDLLGASRVALVALLAGAVPASVRRITARVSSPPSDADLVIGADGVHSVVRRAAWGESGRARLTPYLAVRGVLPAAPAPGATGEYWGRGDLFGIGPAAGGGTNWYAAYRSDLGPTGIDVEQALAVTRVRYRHHAPEIAGVLAAATAETSLAQRIWTTPPMRSYVRGGAVLIGDAGHAMTPNLGRGACEALADAVTLADLLNNRSVGEALAAYDRGRVARTQALRIASSAVMRVALAERAQPLRDRLLGALPRGVRRGRPVPADRRHVPSRSGIGAGTG